MIRRTLRDTQLATYSVDLPDPGMNGMPRATGTGFFVSPDGWFITAAHVVTQDGSPNGLPRRDIQDCWLMKEARPGQFMSGMCQFAQLDAVLPDSDVAFLKVDFAANANKAHLQGLTGFPHLRISRRHLEEGEPVYAFGYPLPESELLVQNDHMTIAHSAHAPRTTSAIVAATMDRTLVVSSGQEAQVYVLDKALNYGNSGGPIIATETGRAHALCSRFQPVAVPQAHVTMANGDHLTIVIPSLYGIVSSLSDPRLLEELEKRRVPITDD
jgi:S1-C subfamily serine protease